MAFEPDEPVSRFVPDEEKPASFLDRFGKALSLTAPPVAMIGNRLFSGLEKVGKAAGGFATDAIAPYVPPEVAGAVGAAAEVGIPAVLGGGLGQAVGAAPVKAFGTRVMQSALKPSSKELVSGDAAKAIETMLTEGGGGIVGPGTNVTASGAASLRAKISDLHREVAQKIASSTEMVDKAFVASEVTKTLTKFRQQVNPGADREAILKAWQEFNTTWGPKIPIADAQALKSGTQHIVAKKYGEQSGATTEAEKSMARGLRLGIEDRIPEVGKLNAKEANLLNALYIADKRAGLEGNKNIGGLSFLAENKLAAAAFMADRSSLFKSILARLIRNSADTATAGTGAAIGGVAETLTGQAGHK